MESCANDIVKELREKRQMIATTASELRSILSELKQLRNHVASQETSLAEESASRQAAEARARSLGKELEELQRSLKYKNETLEASSCIVHELEKQRMADQEIQKRLLKLQFRLHAARAQTRKAQRIVEKRKKTIKDLREELRAIKRSQAASASRKQSFWESSCFNIVASVSIVALAIFCKR